MGLFDNATSVIINNKEVQSIITSNGGVLYEKQSSDTLVLTADKNIIQTNETVTLTATLTAADVSGKTISFIIKHGTTTVDTLTGTTNSSGVCSVSYVGEGAGDLNIQADYNSIIQSEIYSIEDCIYYDPMTSASGDWTVPSNVSAGSIFGYSTNGWKYGNISSYSRIPLNKSIPVDFNIELDITDYTNDRNPAPSIIFYDSNDNRKGGVAWGKVDSTGTNILNNTTVYLVSSSNATKGNTHRIEVTSSSITIYDDNTLVGSHSVDNNNVSKIELHTGSNRMCQIKNFKIKPL